MLTKFSIKGAFNAFVVYIFNWIYFCYVLVSSWPSFITESNILLWLIMFFQNFGKCIPTFIFH